MNSIDLRCAYGHCFAGELRSDVDRESKRDRAGRTAGSTTVTSTVVSSDRRVLLFGCLAWPLQGATGVQGVRRLSPRSVIKGGWVLSPDD